MKEHIKILAVVLLTVISIVITVFGVIKIGFWLASKLPEPCPTVPYYSYSVKGYDENAGSDLELAKELAQGRPIYIRGNFCK